MPSNIEETIVELERLYDQGNEDPYVYAPYNEAHHQFIVAIHNAFPDLIAEIRRLQAENARLSECVKSDCVYCNGE